MPLTVRGLLADEGPARVLDGNFVLMDIAAAQQALDRFGRVDRDRGPAGTRTWHRPTAEAAIAAAAARRALGAAAGAARRQVEQMLAAFHLNLTALSYVALLVGLFLVYNTVSVAVLVAARARSARCGRSA